MKKLLFALLFLAASPPILFGQNSGTITSTQKVCIDVQDKSTVGIQVAGTWTGTLQPQVSLQGQAAANSQVTPSNSNTSQTTITSNFVYYANVGGAGQFCILGNTVSSGTATIFLNASKGVNASTLSFGGGSIASGTTGQPAVYTSSNSTGSEPNYFYADTYAGATVDVKVNACITAAMAVHGTCDARGIRGNQVIAAEIDIGDAAGDSVSFIPPWTVGQWRATMTDGTSCALRQYPNTSILGSPTAGDDNEFSIQPETGSNLAYIYCAIAGNAGGSLGYIHAEGFGVDNFTAATSTATGIGFYVYGAFDGAVWQHIMIQDRIDAYAAKIDSVCCGAEFKFVQFNSFYHGSSVPLWINSDSGSFNIHASAMNIANSSINHQGTGVPALKVTDTLHNLTLNLSNIYTESSNADATTARYQISGIKAINFDNVSFHAEVANDTSTGITVDNSYNTMLTVNGLSFGTGLATYPYPVTAITHSFNGDTVLTDTSGNLPQYNSATTTLHALYAPDISTVGVTQIAQLATPAAPTVITNCVTTCVSTWAYAVTAKDGQGSESIASPVTSIANGPASLSGGVFNTITWLPVPGATSYNIYRTTAAAGLTGVIAGATIVPPATLTYNDIGGVGNTAATPTTNQTGGVLLTDPNSVVSARIYTSNNGSGINNFYIDTPAVNSTSSSINFCRHVSSGGCTLNIYKGDGTSSVRLATNTFGQFSTFNSETLAGFGIAYLRGVTSQKAETTSADANVLTVTPAASAATYKACVVISVSSATSGVIGWTLSWTDSNGNAQSNIAQSLFQQGAAAPALTFTTSAASNYQSCSQIDVNNAAANIIVKWVGGGTTAAKMSATIQRLQ